MKLLEDIVSILEEDLYRLIYFDECVSKDVRVRVRMTSQTPVGNIIYNQVNTPIWLWEYGGML